MRLDSPSRRPRWRVRTQPGARECRFRQRGAGFLLSCCLSCARLWLCNRLTAPTEAATPQAEPPLLTEGRLSFCCNCDILLRSFGGNDAGGPGFFGLGLLSGHGLVNPVVGRLEIGLTGVRIVALVLGALAVQQVQISHGVVVIGPKLQRL